MVSGHLDAVGFGHGTSSLEAGMQYRQLSSALVVTWGHGSDSGGTRDDPSHTGHARFLRGTLT